MPRLLPLKEYTSLSCRVLGIRPRRFDMRVAAAVSGIQQLSLVKDGLIDADIWGSQVKGFRWVGSTRSVALVGRVPGQQC